MSANRRNMDQVKSLLKGSKDFNSEQRAKFYDNWALTYEQDMETLCYKPYQMVDCLHANFSGNREEVQVLDVACGTGCVVKLMAELGFKNFVGVDSSKGQLEQADRLGLYQDLKLALLGSQPLPAEPGTFDVIMLAGGLGEGFVPVSVLRELCTAAKPGGLICFTWSHHSISETYSKNLATELRLMEEEGLWSQVVTEEIDKYMKDPNSNSEKEEELFIRGTVYLFKKSI